MNSNKKYIKYFFQNLFFAITHLEEIQLIKANYKFKNIHHGKRCFVLGNGPSVDSLDFSLLTNEYVFTVNQIMRKENFEKLNSNYHFIADQNYFKLNINKPEDAELLETLKRLNTPTNHPVCFIPSNQLRFVTKYKLSDVLDISYFCSPINLLDNNVLSLNFTWLVPRFGTVVHFAIAMAIYMGFSEIYLLGCEGTSIIANIHSALKNNNVNSLYCYEINDSQKKWLEKVICNKTMEKCAKSFYDLLVGYRYLSEYCQRHNIALFNCTTESVVDSIAYKDITTVLGEHNDLYNG